MIAGMFLPVTSDNKDYVKKCPAYAEEVTIEAVKCKQYWADLPLLPKKVDLKYTKQKKEVQKKEFHDLINILKIMIAVIAYIDCVHVAKMIALYSPLYSSGLNRA